MCLQNRRVILMGEEGRATIIPHSSELSGWPQEPHNRFVRFQSIKLTCEKLLSDLDKLMGISNSVSWFPGNGAAPDNVNLNNCFTLCPGNKLIPKSPLYQNQFCVFIACSSASTPCGVYLAPPTTTTRLCSVQIPIILAPKLFPSQMNNERLLFVGRHGVVAWWCHPFISL